MTSAQKGRIEAEAKVAKALGHPARLAMIHALVQRRQTVSQLTALVGTDITTVSKHLAQLRALSIVNSTRRGLKVYYTLACPCIPDMLACMGRIVTGIARDHLGKVPRAR